MSLTYASLSNCEIRIGAHIAVIDQRYAAGRIEIREAYVRVEHQRVWAGSRRLHVSEIFGSSRPLRLQQTVRPDVFDIQGHVAAAAGEGPHGPPAAATF